MRIYPDRDALILLVGAVLAQQHVESIEFRRYLGLDLIQQPLAVGTDQKEETDIDLGLSV